jgi:hypothetical protein
MNEGEPRKSLSRTERKKLKRLQPAEQSHSPESRLKRWSGSGLKRLLDILGVIGGIAAVWSFFPAFSVSREPPLDPSSVLTSYFLIRYESPIPVADVDPVCRVDYMEDANNSKVFDLSVREFKFRVPEMWQGDTLTVPCAFVTAFKMAPIVKADITLRIQFMPILIPRFLHLRPWARNFRFVTQKQADGNVRWLPEPLNFMP